LNEKVTTLTEFKKIEFVFQRNVQLLSVIESKWSRPWHRGTIRCTQNMCIIVIRQNNGRKVPEAQDRLSRSQTRRKMALNQHEMNVYHSSYVTRPPQIHHRADDHAAKANMFNGMWKLCSQTVSTCLPTSDTSTCREREGFEPTKANLVRVWSGIVARLWVAARRQSVGLCRPNVESSQGMLLLATTLSKTPAVAWPTGLYTY